jgi:hypothetical protein
MLVQPLDDAVFERQTVELIARGLAGKFLLFANDANRTERERCYEIGLRLADASNERGGDCGRTSTQDESVARRLNRRADHGQIVE